MTRALVLLLFVIGAFPGPARADTAEDVRQLYRSFAAAQNARDLASVEALLIDSPRFLWVSDGKSIWGRKATIKRMALFQTNETWRAEPDMAKAVAVEVSSDTAYLHLPLDLVIGPAGVAPERIGFLVSMLAVKTGRGWRIAALFTTARNPKAAEDGS
jgi:ketosteroid isomerase-like protein